MIPRNLGDLAEFCYYLSRKKVAFSLHYYGADEITLFISIVCARFEVAFSREDVTYSVFRGNEDVESDLLQLVSWIEEYTE